MYALMLVVPALAVARLWAKREGWTIAGIEIFAATGVVVAGVVALHGPLSWTLMALVAGHAGAAAMHETTRRDALAGRMFGSPSA